MKTITLKTDDTFFDNVTNLAKHLHLSKSELIRRAVGEYEGAVKKREMKEQMKQTSLRARNANSTIIKEFDSSIADGLKDV